MPRVLLVVVWLLFAAAGPAASQDPLADPASRSAAPGVATRPEPPAQGPAPGTEAPRFAGSHRLGPHDVVAVAVLQAPELDVSVPVSEQGTLSLPLLGSVRATGLTTQELETSIEAQLRERYIRDPHVTVRLAELRSQPVSIIGAVNRPGTYQLTGAGTLLEALALAGGPSEEAGDTVVVQRGRPTASPVSTAASPPDAAACAAGPGDGCPSIVPVDLKQLLASRDPALNIAVTPGDVIAVQTAAVVYVVGAINKPGSFHVRGHDRVTVLRALALGGGVTPMAATHDAIVLRDTDRGARVEIPVDLDAILKGRVPDVALEAQDVLFVPTSGAKAAARATVDTLIRIVSFRLFP